MVGQRMHDYYTEEYDEETRLTRTLKGQIEYERTKFLASRALPSSRCRVLDAGGGAGIHSRWMAEAGHQVTMCDVIERHVEAARKVGVDACLADARELPWKDGEFDAVLMAGPLYHLNEPSDRAAALAEAVRVTRPGGTVMVTAINRYAPLVGRATASMTSQAADHLLSILRDGRCAAAEGWPGLAYYHTPRELREEMRAAGIGEVNLFGLNGPAAWLAVAVDRYIPERQEDDKSLKALVDDALVAAAVADEDEDAVVLSSLFFAYGAIA